MIAKDRNRVRVWVDVNFNQNFIKKLRNDMSKVMPRPIKSDMELTRILMNKNVINKDLPSIIIKSLRFKSGKK